MSPLAKKILIALGVIVTLGALGFIIYRQEQISQRQLAIETGMVSQKQLLDGIVRSQATWTTKEDLEKLAKANDINLQTIKDDLAKLHADVTSINIAVTTSNGQHGTNIPTKPGPVVNPNPIDPSNPDPYGYMKQQQTLALNEDFGTVKVPIGSVGFSAWQKEPWNYDIKAREYKSSTVVGVDENQRQYYYNKFTVKVDDKEYTLPIKSATTEQIYPEAKFSWWNPRLYLGVDGEVGLSPVKGEVAPSVGLQVMSYGRYKNQPDFSILQVGVGYGINSQRPQVSVMPFSYNVGKPVPLINNTYVGPVISVGTDANVYVGGGIRVGL